MFYSQTIFLLNIKGNISVHNTDNTKKSGIWFYLSYSFLLHLLNIDNDRDYEIIFHTYQYYKIGFGLTRNPLHFNMCAQWHIYLKMAFS